MGVRRDAVIHDSGDDITIAALFALEVRHRCRRSEGLGPCECGTRRICFLRLATSGGGLIARGLGKRHDGHASADNRRFHGRRRRCL